MPSTKGLEVLMGKKQLTDADWIELVEARRKMFSPYFDKFTFGTFGSFECLQSENGQHELKLDGPKLCYDRECACSLETQGIFGVEPHDNIKKYQGNGYRHSEGWSVLNGVMHIWGLTRANKWIIATVEFVGEAGYKGRGKERAVSVIVCECNLQDILRITAEKPERIWHKLGRAILQFNSDRERLYNESCDLSRTVQIENLVLSLFPKEE